MNTAHDVGVLEALEDLVELDEHAGDDGLRVEQHDERLELRQVVARTAVHLQQLLAHAAERRPEGAVRGQTRGGSSVNHVDADLTMLVFLLTKDVVIDTDQTQEFAVN